MSWFDTSAPCLTVKGKRHGYFGYQYTPVVSNGEGKPTTPDPCAYVSLVQAWPETKDAPFHARREPPAFW